jgi:hypothetical protein
VVYAVGFIDNQAVSIASSGNLAFWSKDIEWKDGE